MLSILHAKVLRIGRLGAYAPGYQDFKVGGLRQAREGAAAQHPLPRDRRVDPVKRKAGVGKRLSHPVRRALGCPKSDRTPCEERLVATTSFARGEKAVGLSQRHPHRVRAPLGGQEHRRKKVL